MADAEAVAQRTIAARHHHRFNTSCDGGLHQIIGAEHVRLEGGVEGDAGLLARARKDG